MQESSLNGNGVSVSMVDFVPLFVALAQKLYSFLLGGATQMDESTWSNNERSGEVGQVGWLALCRTNHLVTEFIQPACRVLPPPHYSFHFLSALPHIPAP